MVLVVRPQVDQRVFDRRHDPDTDVSVSNGLASLISRGCARAICRGGCWRQGQELNQTPWACGGEGGGVNPRCSNPCISYPALPLRHDRNEPGVGELLEFC